MSTNDDDNRVSPPPPPSAPAPEVEKAINLDRKGMVVMPHEPVSPIVIENMVGGLPPAPAQAAAPSPPPAAESGE